MSMRNLLFVLPAAMMVASPAASAAAVKPTAAVGTQVGPVSDEVAQPKQSKSKAWLLGLLGAAGLGLGLALSSSGNSQAPAPASP